MTEERASTGARRLADLGWRSFALAGTAAAIGVAVLVALDAPSEPGRYIVLEAAPQAVVPNADPLRAELARCRTLEADTDDGRCRAAWAANRRRFMGERGGNAAPPALPAPDTVMASPTVPER